MTLTNAFKTALPLAGLLAATAAAPQLRAAALGADDITLSGCLIHGEGDSGGYLLANSSNDPAQVNGGDSHVAPSAIGTTGGYGTIFYWLEGSGELKDHVGHRVEIHGDVKGDVKDGELKTERKDNWTELEIKSDGRSMKARVPNASMFPADQQQGLKGRILVRRVDVEHVKMLSASCQ